jgi:hypothetical protein
MQKHAIRVLLQITAMRYACLALADATACLADPKAWCTWDAGQGGCSLQYDDAE